MAAPPAASAGSAARVAGPCRLGSPCCGPSPPWSRRPPRARVAEAVRGRGAAVPPPGSGRLGESELQFFITLPQTPPCGLAPSVLRQDTTNRPGPSLPWAPPPSARLFHLLSFSQAASFTPPNLNSQIFYGYKIIFLIKK
ncbi:hypothetical protein U9M48_042091 [Paspalum notatum var. saurae]|uniref:Uncharacterized protein n=1 Tax=Paspalum notatum var. saurae TaxID=547442 RepID=A0AAQ3UPU3_PASNO